MAVRAMDGATGAGAVARAVSTPLSTAPGISARSAGRRALVIDDLELNRRILAGELSTCGFETEVAGDAFAGLAALERAAHRQRPFDLVLLDQTMPGLSGLALAGRIRAMASIAATRLVLTACAGGDPVTAGLVDAVLAKPIDPHILTDCLERLFAQPKAGPDVDLQRLEALRRIMSADQFVGLVEAALNAVIDHVAGVVQHVAAQDLAAAGRIAHDLISTAGNVGALRLGAAAQAVERAAKAGDRATCAQLAAEVSAAFTASLVPLGDYARCHGCRLAG